MKNKPPAFQFYPSEFLADENVKLMTCEERGAYITLLCHNWIEGSLPDDDKSLAILSDAKERWPLIKAKILKCFCHSSAKKRYSNPRLKKEKKKQKRFSEIKSKSGKLGASARWGKSKEKKQPDGSAIVLPMAKNSSLSLSLSSIKETKKERKKENPVVATKELEQAVFLFFGSVPLQNLQGWLEGHKPERILEAMKLAEQAGVKNVPYVNGILRRWARDGYPKPPAKKEKPWVKNSTHAMGIATTDVRAYGACPGCGFLNMQSLTAKEAKSGGVTRVCSKCRKVDVELKVEES